MPIVNGKYKNPGWVDNAPPLISAQNLNDISDTLEKLDQTAGGGVTSFNGRTGAVTPQAGDYTAQMVGAASMSDVSQTVQTAISNAAPRSVLITLTASGWSGKVQSVSVPGVSANQGGQLILITPALNSQAAYYASQILCTGQGANSLTFTAGTVPTVSLSVYVVIQEVV